jgi:hypothetical protein
MKIFESSDRAKITHTFPAPIGDVLNQQSADFSSILHILNRIFRDSHNLKKTRNSARVLARKSSNP